MNSPAFVVVRDDQEVRRLRTKVLALHMRFAKLQGQATELLSQKAKLTKDIALAKGRIELAPLATETFNYLQEKAHARAVGEFEDLLSAFVEDVIPEAGRVHLELGTERGAPALDIMLDNGGDLESILEGNGGGLTNVVVTGLGFSALSRTSNRQLMVLDEPDCWLKAHNVPAFTKVIAEVANPVEDADGSWSAGCQTLMVSHNDIGLMDEGAHIQDLRIERSVKAFADSLGLDVRHVGEVSDCAHVVWAQGMPGGKPAIEIRYREDSAGDDENNALTKGFPYIQPISGARSWRDALQPGVRWIEVVNVRRHVFTRLNLSSGLNVLTGNVNGGKSTLLYTALRALAYGESDDQMIRHGADCAIVRAGLEDGVVLEMVRNRKGSPKVIYRRIDHGVVVNEGRQETRASVPAFIREALKIECVDGLDIQLRSQKEPIFLLNETAARRAQLLSVGKESGLLQALIEKHRLDLRRDKESVKRDELELNTVNRTLTALGPLAGLSSLADIVNGLLDDLQSSATQISDLEKVLGRLKPLEPASRLASQEEVRLNTQVTMPTLHAVADLAGVTSRLKANEVLAQLPEPKQAPRTPGVHETATLQAIVLTLKNTEKKVQLLPRLPVIPATPLLHEVAPVTLLVGRLKAGNIAALASLVPDNPAMPQLSNPEAMRKALTTLEALNSSIAAQVKDEEAALKAEVTAQQEEHALQHQLGACPTCRKPF